MGKTYERLDDRLTGFIKAQKVFFVASAPLNEQGHVNVSPKGHDSFAVLDENTVAYLDLGGSGIETIAHMRENARITFLFCAFEGAANILRLYGKGEVVTFDMPGFADLLARFPDFSRARAVIVVKLTRIQDSCGWGVPLYEFTGERDQLSRYVHNEKRSPDEWAERYYTNNATSIDGLPGMLRPT